MLVLKNMTSVNSQSNSSKPKKEESENVLTLPDEPVSMIK